MRGWLHLGVIPPVNQALLAGQAQAWGARGRRTMSLTEGHTYGTVGV